MRLKTTIETVCFLALQGIGFRGHDESSSSLNRGNFIEVLKYKAEVNDELSSVILDNTPQNAQYIAPSIQKEILHILANRVRKMICDEITGGKYCILVDEAQDESKTEQMALVLRYVKHDGLLIELFFDIVGVKNTSAVMLKDAISDILVRFDLSIQNLRGQGYDGAITAAKDEPNIWQFFSHLTCIVNLVASSPKRLAELKSFQRDEIARMLSIGEHQSGKWANQIGTLHRAGATCWSPHYDSVRDLIDMYTTSCTVVENLRKGGQTQQMRGQALDVYKQLDVPSDPEFQNTSFLTDLCGKLVVRRKSECYPLVDRLIRLVLTLPVSTATTERAFSGMKRVKTAMRSTMGDEFLADCITVNLERDHGWKIDLESIIDKFKSLRTCRAQLR
ncbi:uncharacterized protein LOC132314769 [Cornus florida]|uniref:uncharacterized protein LOC132314769 n=1 Tax=Cornus florida TaxID=4283 RepID=UPI00289A6398|nr:uncharacterized protein LOC132314769 [Cornus florida]